MKEKVFDFTKIPEDKSTESAMSNAWAIIIDMLSEEDEAKLSSDFKLYRDNCVKNEDEYIPAYLWTLQRINVGIKKTNSFKN